MQRKFIEILPLIGVLLTLTVVDTARAQDSPASFREKAQVAIGHDITLDAGKKAQAVVAIIGNATSAGEVSDSVVAVMGDTHVSGPVANSVVSVLGGTQVDSHVGGAVVAVLGDVELGPHAEVNGDVVGVGGTVRKDAAAVVRGETQSIFPGAAEHLRGLRPWIRQCLLYARPLAFGPGLGWAWTLAFGFLALYVLLALLATGAVQRCAETFETQPGSTLLASVLAVLMVPALFVLLCITVIGIAVVPFLSMALMAAALFGKAVVLACLGRVMLRGMGRGGPWQTAAAVVAGGVVVLALYCIPVIGFIAFKVIGVLGLGVVLYTLFRSTRSRGVAAAPASAAAASAAPVPAPAPAPAAVAAAAPPLDFASLPRAGFWLRMGALFIDFVLIGVATSLMHHGPGAQVMLLVLAIYGALMWKLRGTTIGGIVCNLQVVRMDGRPLDWATSIVRALSCLLSLIAAGLGFFWIAFDPEKQAWHDKIAGTVVVRAPGRSLV
jgi:uncharacterized RDD family membrane protein YckC